MPTYDYRCKACDHTFEQFQSMKDSPLKVCPSCGKKQLERLIGTGGAIIFKGSGFYITDYRSESYKQGEKSAAPVAESTDSKAAAKPTSDSTPASQPAAKPATPEPAAKSTPKSEPAAAASKSAKKRSSGSKR